MNTTEEITPSSNPSSPKLGIVSLVFGILGPILYVLPFVIGYIEGYIAGMTGTARPVGPMDPVNIAGMAVSWCGNAFGLVAFVLGSISITREKRNFFGIAGLVLGALMTCGCIATVAYNISQV